LIAVVKPHVELSKQARYSRRKQSEEAEIGHPPITDEQRALGQQLRQETWDDLEAFNVKVFPNSTGLKPLGEVQRDSIAHDRSVIVGGGKVCKGEPRGYGKTTRTCNGAMWGVLTGRRRMVPIFSANMEKSKNQVMARWKAEILGNDLLFWMYPELIWPLRALENKPQRCASQTMNGEPTRTQWTADRIVFPHAPGVPGSGSALIALPLKSCRGATHTTPDGTVLRPELCIFDDVQKDEDADNPNTVRKLEELIDHTAMMLGGHSQTMSAIMSCTVRHLDDLSEQYLKKPSWRRVRYKMLTSPSAFEKEHWLGTYAEIRQAYDPESPEDQERAHRESLAYYIAHRDEMDRGAVVSWDWAYAWADDEPTEISAVQHAYNILIDLGPGVFASECQNEPMRESGGLPMLSAREIQAKQSNYARNSFPKECTTLTLFADVHPSILYYAVWAWEPNFTGYCIEYGTFPDQRRGYFSHDGINRRLEDLFPGRDLDATCTAGLKALIAGSDDHHFEGLLRREWIDSGGVPMRISRGLVDANGEASDAVKKFIRHSEFSAILAPSYGRGITAKQKPISQWQQSRGRQDIGPEWTYLQPKPGDPQGILFDANFWKTRFHRALALPAGSRSALYLYETEPTDHRMLADHCTSEKPTEVTVGSRVVYEFGNPRAGADNHFFDCMVGNMVAASRAGIKWITPNVKKKPRLSLAEMQQRARGR
jgi:hypothetical protein